MAISIKDLFAGRDYTVKKKRGSWRGEYLDEITAFINQERAKEKFYMKGDKKIPLKPLTVKFVALKTAHLKTKEDFHYLLSICKDSKRRSGSFSKCFFGALKK